MFWCSCPARLLPLLPLKGHISQHSSLLCLAHSAVGWALGLNTILPALPWHAACVWDGAPCRRRNLLPLLRSRSTACTPKRRTHESDPNTPPHPQPHHSPRPSTHPFIHPTPPSLLTPASGNWEHIACRSTNTSYRFDQLANDGLLTHFHFSLTGVVRLDNVACPSQMGPPHRRAVRKCGWAACKAAGSAPLA